jgi:pentose-5-phosphate-3-epimerase
MIQKLTPIIMDSDVAEVRQKVATLYMRGEKRVHIDIGDGMLSPYWSVTPADLSEVKLVGLELDIHLLVDDPAEWIEETVAIKPTRIIGQIERMGSQSRFLAAIASYGGGVWGGLAVGIETPIEALENEALKQCEVALLMAVPVGTYGNKFDERVLPKIRELRARFKGKILIDGGINKETMEQTLRAGADEVGANSAYWRGEWERIE